MTEDGDLAERGAGDAFVFHFQPNPLHQRRGSKGGTCQWHAPRVSNKKDEGHVP